jgi:glycosyltransferase involved in cell wall biosynthesis
VGKFVPKKRPFDLIKGTIRLRSAVPGKEIHLLWVGTGELANELRQACNACFDSERGGLVPPKTEDARPNASFLGFLNQTEITQAYVAADCLVLPSDCKETWGLVVNEAMASGLSCIVSSACGCAEDLVKPLQPDLTYSVGNILQLQRAMTAALVETPAPASVRALISNYDVVHTVDTIERLYCEKTESSSIEKD